MKISEIKLPQVVGICGVARCGKDTVCLLSQKILEKTKQKVMRAGFADSVKADLHNLLVKKVGISAYTEDSDEKKLIRPLMVEYGTGLMRRINKEVWINRMEPNLDLAKTLGVSLFITDVRYENEVEWIKNNGGKIVHVEQEGKSAANEEEENNDPVIKKLADEHIYWKEVGSDKLLSLKPKVTKVLKSISC